MYLQEFSSSILMEKLELKGPLLRKYFIAMSKFHNLQ